MRLRPIAIAVPMLCLAAATASAEQVLLATAVGPTYDAVANCLMKEVSPRLAASPVVHPPPMHRAEVLLYIRGTRDGGLPVATFFVNQPDGGPATIRFEERSDQRGQHTAIATAAAAQCSR